jgi:hypothetical protein
VDATQGIHRSPPCQIPDTATAVLGILLTVTVLAIAGRPGQAEPGAEKTCDACPGQGGQNVVPPPPRWGEAGRVPAL